ncbi:hypothetical protein [Blastopirellula marina]|uniref:Uncharacterized protein n=1 Tax=Blastopirellula marina TaxID=124 RepID=A0A2S8GB29_9BACT|nr:hypothetical protein [Blastopirellula marina]PQO41662.1 hypothetical protein C5Y98_02760 [Blastopirellula marina]PTL46105.1 hypothetical protein C5Y97_02760 [Blastopirellula marina]
MADAIVEEKQPEARFTLRKLFAWVWVVAALLGSVYRLDPFSPLLLAFLGLPAAALGYLVISGQKHEHRLRYALILWVALAMLFGVVLPIMFNRLSCPFELPPSATRLQASDRMNGFTGADTQVTFHASVKDCYATLAKVERVYRVKFGPGLPIDHPLPNSRFTFIPAWGNSPRHQLTWFNPNKIEEGEYFSNGLVQVWIDTKRGVFYMDAHF